MEQGRDPTSRTAWGTKTRPEQVHLDRCPCLKASGPNLHVFALGEGCKGQLSIDRMLRIHERASLQGFPVAISGVASRTDAIGKRVFGNAMTVSVIGSVLAVELRCLSDTHAPHSLLRLIGQFHSGPQTDGSSAGPLTACLLQDGQADLDDENKVIMPDLLLNTIGWGAKRMDGWQMPEVPRPLFNLTSAGRLALAARTSPAQGTVCSNAWRQNPNVRKRKRLDSLDESPHECIIDTHRIPSEQAEGAAASSSSSVCSPDSVVFVSQLPKFIGQGRVRMISEAAIRRNFGKTAAAAYKVKQTVTVIASPPSDMEDTPVMFAHQK